MKTIIYSLLMVGFGLIHSFAQTSDPCPGVMQIIGWDEVQPVCGSTNQYQFNVYTDRPNSNVSYAWGLNWSDCFSLPSGWSFVSAYGGGNATYAGLPAYVHYVRFTPNAFGGNNATAFMRSKAYCSTPPDYSNWVSFTIHRPVSALTRSVAASTSFLCSGNTATFTLNTQTGDNTFLWSTTGPTSINSGNGSTTIYVGPTGNGTSSGNVSFKDGCSNNFTRSGSLYAGVPQVYNFSVNSQSYNPSTNGYICTGSNQTIQADIAGYTSTNWSITSGNAYNASLSAYGNTASFTPYGADYFNISLDATNSCGTGSNSLYFYSYDCYYRYSISPNPAVDQITIQFDKTEKAEALPDEINLLSEKSTKPIKTINVQELYQKQGFKDGTKVEIPVKELERGVYYLKVLKSRQASDKQVETIRIILE